MRGKETLAGSRNRNGSVNDRTPERPEADTVTPTSTLTPARILVVEDQDDVRRMLVMALEIEGHVVDEAASAADGLKKLQDARYKLVLSDYAMPGGTGIWMLHEATRLGLMEHSIALIVTAHPDVRKLADVDVITKPLDLDQFLAQVRKILTNADALMTKRSGQPGAGNGSWQARRGEEGDYSPADPRN